LRWFVLKKKLIAMTLGLGSTLFALDLWAGTFTPAVQPDERLVLDDTFYEHNAQLDAAFAHIQAQQHPRIITLGDSTMYGSVVYENETIPFFLRQALQQQNPNTSLTNLAYPGARPADLYAMIKRSADVQPDLVVIDVNVVFYSERILSEGALANKTLKRDFLLEPVVPHNLFTDNRVEETLKTLLKNTNLGQNQTAVNKQLFNGQPRDIIRQAVAALTPPQAAEPAAPNPTPAESILGVPWTSKKWDEKEVANMSRIYGQGALTEDNDSVQMLRRTLEYAQKHNIKVLYYLTPQNEALIGKFFDLAQLRRNEDFLKNILDRAGAWYLDLRDAVPSAQFGDYDHMLRDAHLDLARVLAQEIAAKGGLPQ
jgi:hypothetical protein